MRTDIPRDVGQMLITKLDLGHIKVSEAVQHASLYGLQLTARTRSALVKQIGAAMKPADQGGSNQKG